MTNSNCVTKVANLISEIGTIMVLTHEVVFKQSLFIICLFILSDIILNSFLNGL